MGKKSSSLREFTGLFYLVAGIFPQIYPDQGTNKIPQNAINIYNDTTSFVFQLHLQATSLSSGKWGNWLN
jgi:hypothetical protein